MTATKPLRHLLTAKLVARLAMRWQESQAYVPTGSTTVHCHALLPDDERAAFDSYVIGYQDAIDDILWHLDGGHRTDLQPLALTEAENSVFQGGSPPPAPRQENRQHQRPRGRRPVNKNSEARRRLEDLFSGGGNG